MNIKAVVWDYDGTIVDSLPDHHRALSQIFALSGVKIPPLRKMCDWWYMPCGPRFRALGVLMSEEEIWPLYDQIIGDRNHPIFPGVKETLAGLRRRGILSFVVTASPYPEQVIACLVRHEVADLFDDIYCDRESKVEELQEILERYGLCPRELIFVGDMVSDMRDAKEVGVQAWGFDGGYGGQSALLKAGAENIIATHAQIFQAIDPID